MGGRLNLTRGELNFSPFSMVAESLLPYSAYDSETIKKKIMAKTSRLHKQFLTFWAQTNYIYVISHTFVICSIMSETLGVSQAVLPQHQVNATTQV